MLRRLSVLLPTLLLSSFASALPAAAHTPKNSPVAFQRKVINGVRAYVVTVDLNCKRIALSPLSSNGRYKSFHRFMKESHPLAAINGTFFDPASANIVCNLIRDGRLLSEGRVGHTLRIDRDNQAALVSTAGLPGRLLDLKNWVFGLSGGPTLLRSNHYIFSPWKEGFRDRGLLRLAPRSAIGITKHNKLLLVAVRYPVRLQRLAWMMKALGARDAMNLDGGSSTALYYQGKFVARPRRMLTNVVVVTMRDPVVVQAPPPLPHQPLYDAEAAIPVAWEGSSAEAPLDPEYQDVPDVEPTPIGL